jgi:WD40 repeat protein
VAISPDGRTLAIGTPAKAIHLFGLTDGAEIRRIDGLGGRAHVLTFSPDGTRLLSGGEDQSARTWDVGTGRPLGEPIKHRSWVEAIAVAPDGRSAASAGQDSLIRVWDTKTTRELVQVAGHEFWLWSAAIAPDGATAFTSAFDDTIRTWDAATGRPQQVFRFPDRVISIALSPTGRVLAVSAGRPGEVRLLDPESGRELRRLHGHARGFYDSLAFSSDGSRIVAAGGEDRTLRLWDVATGRSLRIFKHGEEVRAAAISPDGTVVAGAGYENKVRGAGRVIRIWDAATGRHVRELRGHKQWASALAFSPDGKWFASGGHSIRQGIGIGDRDLGSPDLSDSIHLWDVATGTDLRQFPGEVTDRSGGFRNVNALAFTPDGRTLISGEEDGSIVFYDASSAAVRATLRGHLSGVRAVHVSADGRRLVSASTDLTALVWDLAGVLEGRGAN